MRLATLASANMEYIVASEFVDRNTPLPAEVLDGKIPGCQIVPDFEDDQTGFEILLPGGKMLVIQHSRPTLGYAGSSVNLARIAKALGLEVQSWLAIADDPHGQAIYRFLEKNGVRVNPLECSATALTVGVYDEMVKKTTLFMQKPKPHEYSLSPEVRRSVIFEMSRWSPQLVAMTSIGEVELDIVPEIAEAMTNAMTLFIPRISILGKPRLQDRVLKAMACSRLVCFNRRELRQALGTFSHDEEFNPEQHLPELISRFRGHYQDDDQEHYVVVTCGPHGEAAAIHRGGETNEIIIQPPQQVEVVEPTGAGDAFALAAALALAKGQPWKTALSCGAKLAVANSQGPGGGWAAGHIDSTFFDQIKTDE